VYYCAPITVLVVDEVRNAMDGPRLRQWQGDEPVRRRPHYAATRGVVDAGTARYRQAHPVRSKIDSVRVATAETAGCSRTNCNTRRERAISSSESLEASRAKQRENSKAILYRQGVTEGPAVHSALLLCNAFRDPNPSNP
jgi:hypothetical protein